MGRDPIDEPLTPLELSLFDLAIAEHVEAEYTPKDTNGSQSTVPQE